MSYQFQPLFSLFVGVLGLFVITLLLFSYKSNKLINGYLAVAFFIASMRSISSALEAMEIIYFTSLNLSAIYSLALIALPCIYLYLKSLSKPIKEFKIKNVLHFIFPGVLFMYFGVLNYTANHDKIIKLFKFGVLFYILFYLLKILIFFFKNLQNDQELKQIYPKHYTAIKRWIHFLFIISVLILFRLLIVLSYEIYSKSSFSGHSDTVLQSVLFLALSIKILMSPEILFGYPKLIKQLDYSKEDVIINELIWSTSIDKITNVQESKLKDKITQKTNSYILAIDQFVTTKHPFRDPNYAINELSNDLKIPTSHLAYIFKYHCNIAFVEYKNYTKINDAMALITAGFLDSKTLDALGYFVGFKSYNSFFVSFKKYTNYAPKEYLDSLHKKIETH